MKMKVLLIGDSPISMSPYIASYIEVYEQNNIPYDLVFWNKTLEDTTCLTETVIPYNKAHDINVAGWKKIPRIYGFAHFAKKVMKKNKYSYVVVFTIAHAVFFYPFLKKYYKGRYIFDIRDYSPLCKVRLLRNIIEQLIKYSAFTVISSAGFLRWLPQNESYHYVISHNTTRTMIDKYINQQNNTPPGHLDTI